MKPICLWCGEYFVKSNPKRIYCSQECNGKMNRRRPLDFIKHRKVLANIINAAETDEEFATFYEKFFCGDRDD